MPPMARWVLAAACSLLAGAPQCGEAKMVMGIAEGRDYQLVTTFCFTFPSANPAINGHIHSQTIVSSSNHKFLVLNYTDLQKELPCQELVNRAKVLEPLNERTKEIIAYDLTLNVEPSMNRQQIAAVIARCGDTVNAEYIVEFTNPGGFLEQHFACSDQGLLESYLWFSLVVGLFAPAFVTAHRVLVRRQAHNDLSALFFAGAAFCGARIWLFTVHLLVYSSNGMGLGMLHFLSQFLDFLSTTMATLVLMALTHGVYVTRPAVPPGSEERKIMTNMFGFFAASYLLSTLVCGMRTDALLTPFGMLQGAASWPYLVARACAGIFCFNKGLNHAVAAEAQHKKQYVVRFGMIALAWLMTMPLIMLFSGEESWNRSAAMLDAANLAMFGAVLYDLWPSRFGTLFSCMKPTERRHPYSEFGLGN